VDTFFWYWEFPTLCDLDWGLGLISWSLRDILDRLDDFVALEDFTENNVLAIEMAISC